ncbi:recombinase family protein [Enterococcus sp. 22-H-5-01]|uniref:recombinase family protein n=1 Tax=Enterococcus sp. 22-H-5-01 TaxID=3418555 RepID=UPI003CFF39FB
MNLSYDRTSMDKKHKVSNDAQYNVILGKAEADGNLPLLRFSDRGLSGATEVRPAYQTLTDEVCTSYEKRCLYVWKYDRLSRHLKTALTFYDLCLKHNVEIISVGDPIPKVTATNLAQRRMAIQLIFMMAEFQRETIRENINSTLTLKRQAKKYLSSQIAFGYQLINGEVEQVVDQAKIVRLIYDLYVKTGLGFTAIQNELNNREELYRKNQPFKQYNVRGILMNPIYYGCVHGGTEKPYIGDFDPIITREQFDRAQKIREDRHVSKHADRHYLLRGKIVCSKCGWVLTPHWVMNHQKNYRYYYCANKKCGAVRVNAGIVEREVTQWLKNFVNESAQFQAIKEKITIKLKSLDQQKRKTNQKIQTTKSKLMKQYEIGEITTDELKKGLRMTQTTNPNTPLVTEAELDKQLHKLLNLKNKEIVDLIVDEVKAVRISEEKKIEEVILNGV